MRKSKWIEVEVEVDLKDFDDQDLIDELQHRGIDIDTGDIDIREALTNIYEKRKMGIEYQLELDQLLWQVIGRM